MSFEPRTPRRLTLAAILSLLGASASIYLSSLYYSLRSGTAGFKSICNVNSALNCDTIAASPYAELFGGLPLSSLAAGGFLSLLVVSLLCRNREWRRDAIRVGLALSAIAVLFSLYYLAIMAFQLKTFCLFCLSIDVAAFGLLAIFISLKPASLASAPFNSDHLKTLIGLPVGVVLLTVIFLKGMDQLGSSKANFDEMAISLLNTPIVAVETGPEHPVMGAADAPITIVEFSDFQCPHCRHGAVILKALQSRHPRQVKVIYKSYPLDSACNRKMESSMHPAACEAARSVVCAQEQGQFQPLYEKIFENQETLAPGVPTSLAGTISGIDSAKFTACMASPASAEQVSKDVEEGIQLGVMSTPTFFINGRKVEGAFPVPVWSRMVDELLKTSNR